MLEDVSSAGGPYVDVNVLCLSLPTASPRIVFEALHRASKETAWKCSPWESVLDSEGVSYSLLLQALSMYLLLDLVALAKWSELSKTECVNPLSQRPDVSLTSLA